MSEASEAIDISWESDVEDFPSIEESGESNEEVNNESVSESKDSTADISGEEANQEDTKVNAEASESKEEDISGEKESPGENKVIDINELPDDTIVKTKVDGEIKEISLKEYKNGISGEKAIAKRFSEYDKKEKGFKAELDEVNSYVNEFASKMKAQDPVAALEYLAQFAGTPSYEVKDMLIKALLPEINRRQEMMPEQLELEKSRAQLKYEREQAESEQSKFKKEQAEKELSFKIESVQGTHNISQDDWESAFKSLDAKLPPGESITIDTVKEYVLFSRAEIALNEVDSKLVSDKGIMDSFVSVQLKNPDFNAEDLVAIAKDAFGKVEQSQAKEELQEVVQNKEGKESLKKNVPDQEIKPEFRYGEEVDDWDDL